METGQLATFVWLVLTGMALSFLFDCYRSMRGSVCPRGLLNSVTDLIFWLIATVIVFAVLIRSNWGEMRLYVFISLLGGVLVYYQLLSHQAMKLVAKGLKTFQVLILQPFFYTLRIITFPFRFLGRQTHFLYRGVQGSLQKLWRKFELFLKKAGL